MNILCILLLIASIRANETPERRDTIFLSPIRQTVFRPVIEHKDIQPIVKTIVQPVVTQKVIQTIVNPVQVQHHVAPTVLVRAMSGTHRFIKRSMVESNETVVAKDPSKLLGEWRLTSSENFEELMKEMGVGWFMRKMGMAVKPNVKFELSNDEWTLTTISTFKTTVIKFKIDTKVNEVTADGRDVKVA